jgi:hypothetical protein
MEVSGGDAMSYRQSYRKQVTLIDTMVFEFLYTPNKDISYAFILYAYLAATVTFAVLLVLDLVAHIEAVKGYYIIFTPFIPCLVWAVFMKNLADKRERASIDTKKTQ